VATPSTLPADITSWETGCGRPRSRQRNPGFCSSFEAPRGPCTSPLCPGAGTPPPSAGEGGSAGHSAPSCQRSSTSHCPPSQRRAPAQSAPRAAVAELVVGRAENVPLATAPRPRGRLPAMRRAGHAPAPAPGKEGHNLPSTPTPAPNPSENVLVLRHRRSSSRPDNGRESGASRGACSPHLYAAKAHCMG